MNTSIGIDYSFGRSNYNPNTGIHFGVISQHSIMGEALSDIEPVYPECECERGNDEECTCEYWESIGLEYDEEGYKIIDCLDSDLMILESPFYTFAQYCSPCVPGAGNLESPVENGVKTYCLGCDWFDEYYPCPYTRIWSVETGNEIIE